MCFGIELEKLYSKRTHADSFLYSFAIGYIYSFIAAGVFYWGFNRFFPHTQSQMDHAETGEEIIAEQDAKNIEKRRAKWAGQKPKTTRRAFQV